MIDPRRALCLCLCLAACGDDGGGDDDGIDAPDGAAIRTPGGGVVSPGIAGVLNVFAVDATTDQPIAGAAVRVETATPIEATTDGDGLAKLADGALSGPQTITVTAPGHVATTWIGVAGHDVTIPLGRPTASVPTATVSGTIAGWNNLPAPAFGNYTLGLVLASYTDDVAGAENNLTQPAPGGTPANTCVRSALSNDSDWSLVARTGPQVHFAVIVEGDPNGTTSDVSDDTYTLRGYAVGNSMTLAAGQTVTGEALELVPAGQLVDTTVTFPAAPSGLGDVIGIPMLDLGTDGRIVFPLPTVTPASRTTRVIAPTGRFAGTYELVALATPPGAAAAPYATTIARGIASPATLGAGPWLAPPTQVTMSGRAGSFTAPASNLRYATIRNAGGTVFWSVSLLDGASAFQLPALATDPLPSGSLTLEITPADVPGFDAGDFRVAELVTTLSRASGATATFTH